MKACHGIVPVFDDPNLVSVAGLVPVLELAESAGLSETVGAAVTLPVANVMAKARTVLAGMAGSSDPRNTLNSGSCGDRGFWGVAGSVLRGVGP